MCSNLLSSKIQEPLCMLVFRSISSFGGGAGDSHDRKIEDKLSKATKDSNKLTTEVVHGLMSQVLKNYLFNDVKIKDEDKSVIEVAMLE